MGHSVTSGHREDVLSGLLQGQRETLDHSALHHLVQSQEQATVRARTSACTHDLSVLSICRTH